MVSVGCVRVGTRTLWTKVRFRWSLFSDVRPTRSVSSPRGCPALVELTGNFDAFLTSVSPQPCLSVSCRD